MPRYDFRTPRLYLDEPLRAGASALLSRAQANYLGNVLRLKPGHTVLVFNGRDGEWRARLARVAVRELDGDDCPRLCRDPCTSQLPGWCLDE